ncbi:MAG: tandem-95 repeat protein, partial [Propionibacteriaceae bacterium]|nr:tandem-95 repeat protein [Propionibacteriaceae bacterium]
MRGKRRFNLPAVIVICCTLVFGVLALIHQGVPTAEVDMNDGGIWVTAQSRQLVAHVNYDSKLFDAGLNADETSKFDIGQHEDLVTLTDQFGHAISVIEPAEVKLGSSTSLTETATVVQGGERLGILDAGTGFLWTADAHEPSTTSFEEGSAAATGLVSGVVTAGVDGSVHAIAARAKRFVHVTHEGMLDKVSSTEVNELSPAATLSITAVGDKAVALDSTSNTLILPDGSLLPLVQFAVTGDVVLQEPGPDADHLLLATSTALLSVKLDGSELRQTPASETMVTDGYPAAPVRLGKCEYAAWGGSAAYLRQCDDAEMRRIADVPELGAAQNIKFRTNRNLIVLNDIDGGSVWLPDEDMVLAAGLDEIDQEIKKKDEEETAPQTTNEYADPKEKKENHPPKANPDEFGVRAGRITTLDVLGNDSDEDGDVLTAELNKVQTSFGKIARARGGQALQIDVPADATGETSFLYNANDGNLASASAEVKVRVVPSAENSAPKQLRNPEVKVGARASVEYNVLPDWRDPESDPIYLKAVRAAEGIQVHFREEGTVVIRDIGHGQGLETLEVEVSDGSKVGKGKLTLNIQQKGNLDPIANADFYVGRADEPVLAQPLANDSDPNGDPLRLVEVRSNDKTVKMEADYTLGTFTATATTEGQYLFVYYVSDGTRTVPGVVRIDIVKAADSAAPVAEDDLALLPDGGFALVAPLNNDSDPSGGVLVVQSIDVPDRLGLQVALVDHHLLRITSAGSFDSDSGPVSFSYVASNGKKSATAEVLVIPTAAQKSQPPELQPDRVKVRVNDIGSVSVLENDSSPIGLPLSVSPKLQVSEKGLELGTPFVTGNQVRLEAGGEAGTVEVSYTVFDSSGRFATSQVTFDVVGDADVNHAPQPKPLTAWAVVGQLTKIPVPLNGIDPDGDSTVLIGPNEQPTLGAVKAGTDWLEYTPTGQPGTDIFTYIVEDRLGKQASATVRIGIAEPPGLNQDPYAVRDTILVRPERTVSMAVMANDIDSDGDQLALVEGSLKAKDESLQPQINGTAITVTSPAQEGSYVFTYQITDGNGGFSTGTATINVKNDAVLQPPLARDDVVNIQDLPPDGSPVEVRVLENDEDPDGNSALLEVSCDSEDVEILGKVLRITPMDARRLVVYTIIDEDGLEGKAVVWVPGKVVESPYLDTSRLPLHARAGEELEIDLAQYVIVPRPSRTVHIT